MLLKRSGEERPQDELLDACNAASSGSSIGVGSPDPSASPASLKKVLFLRFYGQDFDTATRERILRALKKRDLGRREFTMKAFLSHSSKDKQFVAAVAKELGRQFCVFDEQVFETGSATVSGVRHDFFDNLSPRSLSSITFRKQPPRHSLTREPVTALVASRGQTQGSAPTSIGR
jgi:hypothetical protein